MVEPERPPAERLFACRNCGSCCLGRGGVYLREGELSRVAAFLDVSLAELKERYLSGPKAGPGGEALFEAGVGSDNRCLFYRSGCLIHPLKPEACRLWPYFPRPLSGEEGFLEAASHCPGLEAMGYRDFLASHEAFGLSG